MAAIGAPHLQFSYLVTRSLKAALAHRPLKLYDLFVRNCFLMLMALTAFSAHAIAPASWSRPGLSSASRGRADTGVTDPILYDLPLWARVNGVERSIISLNPAMLADLPEERPRLFPIAAQHTGAGDYYQELSPFTYKYKDINGVVTDLDARVGEFQESRLLLESSWIAREIGINLSADRYKHGIVSRRNDVLFEDFTEYGLRAGTGSRLFGSETLFNIDFGVGLKAIYRQGGGINLGAEDRGTTLATLSERDFKRKSLGFGADAGLLVDFAPLTGVDWPMQVAFVWRDVGTTQFVENLTGSSQTRTPHYASNPVVGIGLGLPKFRDGFRSALRVEYDQWGRAVDHLERLSLGYELRAPVLASFNLGLRKGSLSGALTLRFRGMEIDFATASRVLLYGRSKSTVREYLIEGRLVF